MYRSVLLFVLLFPWCGYAQTTPDTGKCRSSLLIPPTAFDHRFLQRQQVPLTVLGVTDAEKACRAQKGIRHNRTAFGLFAGSGVTLGVGAGLVVTGLIILSPKDHYQYATGRTLILAGISSVAVSVPLFLVGHHYRRKAKADVEKLKNL